MGVYAIGDVHGCHKALKTLFKAHDFQPDDLIVCLGDYVDRGPDSRRVIKYLLKKSAKHRMVFLQGNHELMMLSARQDEGKLKEWLHFGGDAVLKSYGIRPNSDWADQLPQKHWDFISNARSYYEYEDFIFVHAGLAPGIPLGQQVRHDLFWKKYFEPDAYVPGKIVICGHTARKDGKVADFGHTVCIDTYAYGGQWLTCLNVETGDFKQANQKGKLISGTLKYQKKKT